MEDTPKGTVVSLASMFPIDEAQKAAKQVEEAIAEKQKEMEHIKEFIADNSNLINLVSRLPNELHHDIMVPFGKAAFFPGRLIHTNEFVVLLGEGYYAERTSKQTVEILKRRGKVLDSQVESLKANIKDLQAEASFFDATASEAAKGLVEIREDYVEENSSKRRSKSDGKREAKKMMEGDEYAHIMSRLDELEREELAAEGDDENNEDEQPKVSERDNESNKDKQTNAARGESDSESHEDLQTKAKFNQFPHGTYSEVKTRKPQEQSEVGKTTVEVLSNKYHHQLDIRDQSNPLKSSFVEDTRNIQGTSKEQTVTSLQTSKPRFDSSKAFTGSIVEHTHNIQSTSQEKTSISLQSSSQPSKPVSRFKMQRR